MDSLILVTTNHVRDWAQLALVSCNTFSIVRVATKRGVGHGLGHGVGHGLSYGLPVVNFVEQFTLKSLEILNIFKHKREGIALVTAKVRIRYILALKHKSEPCI